MIFSVFFSCLIEIAFFFLKCVFSAQTVSLIWHVSYIDRVVIDHKERELHRLCYRIINDDHDNNSIEKLFLQKENQGFGDFDFNAYLAEHVPTKKTTSTNQTQEQHRNDRINLMLGKMNETDQQILHLMDYYEKQP